MKIYLDDDSADHVLVRLLTAAGHEVLIPADVGTMGQKDPVHFMFAIQNDKALLTHNHEDYAHLHRLVRLVGGHHPGVCVVRRDNDASRDLSRTGIVNAIRKLLASGAPIADELNILNHWR